jgi:adenylosuccinate synthase
VLHLGFFDYWYPELAGVTDQAELTDEHWNRIKQVEAEVGVRPSLIGTGPDSVIDLR